MKKLWMAFSALLLATVLAACGGSGGSAGSSHESNQWNQMKWNQGDWGP